MISTGYSYMKEGVKSVLHALSPSNIREQFSSLRSMSCKELFVGFFKLNFRITYFFLHLMFIIFWLVICTIISLFMISIQR